MNKIHFLTIETDIHSGYESKLLHSCNLKNIQMNVYGKGVQWEGFISKFKILKDILPTIDSELICLTDSRDVLYMADGDKIYTTKYPITLDYDCKIFQCIWDEDWGRSNNFDLMYRKNTIYNRLTDTYPLIYHAPGPTTTLSQVWKILNGRYYKPNQNNFW